MTDFNFVPDETKESYEYAVSACLCGINCRYDGNTKPVPKIKELYDSGRAILVCPEVMGGLEIPRAASEIIGDKVIDKNGRDNTEAFKTGAEKALELCKKYGVKKAILKQNSPSCGCKHIYDGTFSGRLIAGMGVAAKLLAENGIKVAGEKD